MKKLLWGFIDTRGEFVIPPTFDDAAPFREGIARVKIGWQRGFIRRDGSYLVEPKFELAGEFHEGLAWVALEDKYGYVGPDGEIAIPLQFDKASDFKDGLAYARLSSDRYAYINKEGKPIGGRTYGFLGEFADGLARVLTEGDGKDDNGGNTGKYGFIGASGEMVIEARFEFATDFKEGVAIVAEDGKYGCIDTSGTYLVKPEFDKLPALKRSEEFLRVAPAFADDDMLASAAAPTGNAEPQLEYHDGLARYRASARGKWGYVGVDGKPAFKKKFVEAGDFEDGLALVLVEV